MLYKLFLTLDNVLWFWVFKVYILHIFGKQAKLYILRNYPTFSIL